MPELAPLEIFSILNEENFWKLWVYPDRKCGFPVFLNIQPYGYSYCTCLMKCASKKDKGMSVLIWSWSQQNLTVKNSRKLLFPVLKVNGFSFSMFHQGSIWDALGITILLLLGETDVEKTVLAQSKTLYLLTNFYICFILSFLRI